MQALEFRDGGTVELADHPEPELSDPGDAIVRVSTAAICGSDLHLLHGRIPGMRPGSVIGHEFVGTIEQTGDGVARFRTGDRVVGSFLISDGTCWSCRRGEFNNCERMWALGYGLFLGDLDGADAEFVRIPDADVNLHAVDSLADEQAIFAGDILTTGTYACARAAIQSGETVAIIGAGPVGLFCLMNARPYEPGQILVVDVDAARLEMAAELGATPVDASKVNTVVEIQRLTAERGADVVIECVGSSQAFATALDAARAGGRVVVIGVTAELAFELPIGEVWRRGLQIIMGGTCNVQAHWDRALALVADGTVDPTVIVTHTLPLTEGVKGFELFDRREALKVLLKP